MGNLRLTCPLAHRCSGQRPAPPPQAQVGVVSGRGRYPTVRADLIDQQWPQHFLNVLPKAQHDLARDGLLEFEVGHATMGQGRATEGEGAGDNAQNRKGFHGQLP